MIIRKEIIKKRIISKKRKEISDKKNVSFEYDLSYIEEDICFSQSCG